MDALMDNKKEMRGNDPNSNARLHVGHVYHGADVRPMCCMCGRTSTTHREDVRDLKKSELVGTTLANGQKLIKHLRSAQARPSALSAMTPRLAPTSVDNCGSPEGDLERYRANDLHHYNLSCRTEEPARHAIEAMTGAETCLDSDMEAHKVLDPGQKDIHAALAGQPDVSRIARLRHYTVSGYMTARLRIASKTTILVAAPLCFHVMRNYGVSRGLLLPPGSELPRNAHSCHTKVSRQELVQYEWARTDWYKKFSEPEWLLCPDSLLFLAASMGAGALLARYHQLNREDKFQNWMLLTLTFLGLATSICSGRTFLATNLTVTPWVVFSSLVLSDLVHLGIQRYRSAHGVDDLDGKQACEIIGIPE